MARRHLSDDVNATNSTEEALSLIREWQTLATEDALGAKRKLTRLIDSDKEFVLNVLKCAEGPAFSRVRQVVARIAAEHLPDGALLPLLRAWSRTESDEFTARAIRAVLQGQGEIALQTQQMLGDLPSVFDTYSYLSGRIQHRVQNAFPPARLAVDRLKRRLQEIGGTEMLEKLSSELATLQGSFLQFEKAISLDLSSGDFQSVNVDLIGWLVAYAKCFSDARNDVEVSVRGDVSTSTLISANEFLLQTVFENLWSNSLQAAEMPAQITNVVTASGDFLRVTIVDNGPGFPSDFSGEAFKMQFSTKGKARGRGLMEVADAMSRMGGTASLARMAGSTYRSQLSFVRTL